MLNLDLQKAQQGLQLSLQKAGIDTAGLAMELCFVLDVSGSFEDEHRDGSTGDLLTRFVPWALMFDPDKKMDLVTFSNGSNRVHHVGEVTEKNYVDYIKNYVINKVPGWCGGTDYSYAIEEAMRIFGWLSRNGQSAPPKSGGVFGGLFGKKTVTPVDAVAKRKSLVIFITDGDNSDESRTRQVLRDSQERHDDIYFLLIGYSNQGGKFKFLNQIADEFDNTGLVIVRDIPKFVNQSDDQLNEQLLGEELITWLRK